MDTITKQEAEKLRKDALKWAKADSLAQLKLAEVLFRICDGIADPGAPPIYVQWGYPTFTEYVERELNFGIRAAQRLRYIWFRFFVDLDGVVPLATLEGLGVSKLRLLAALVTRETAVGLCEQAKKLTCAELEAMVQRAKQAHQDENQPLDPLGNLIFRVTPEERLAIEKALAEAEVRLHSLRLGARRGKLLALVLKALTDPIAKSRPRPVPSPLVIARV